MRIRVRRSAIASTSRGTRPAAARPAAACASRVRAITARRSRRGAPVVRKERGGAIGACPFVGTNGELYLAWNDYAANTIAFNRSFDGGVTWDKQRIVAFKQLPFDIAVPAEFNRGALVYPACDTDRSKGAHRGRLVCSWMDLAGNGTSDIFTAYSDDKGTTWSLPQPATDQLPFAVDRFNQWLSIDPTNGVVNGSFYDTRNDTTGSRYERSEEHTSELQS